jgi:hypothetical protein
MAHLHSLPPPSNPEDANFTAFMLSLFTKAYKSYQAAQKLWELGFPEDALMLSRTIFEILLHAKHMMQDPKSTTKRMVDAWEQEALIEEIQSKGQHVQTAMENLLGNQGLKGLLAVKKRIGLTISYLTTDRVMAAKVAKLKQDLEDFTHDVDPYKEGWWGTGLKRLARELDALHFYNTFYRTESNLIHSHPIALTDFYQRECPDGSIEFLSEPDPQRAATDFGFVPWVTALCLIDVVDALNEAFGLGMTAEIAEIRQTMKDARW